MVNIKYELYLSVNIQLLPLDNNMVLQRVYGMRKKKPEDEEDDEGEDNSVQADSEDGN